MKSFTEKKTKKNHETFCFLEGIFLIRFSAFSSSKRSTLSNVDFEFVHHFELFRFALKLNLS